MASSRKMIYYNHNDNFLCESSRSCNYSEISHYPDSSLSRYSDALMESTELETEESQSDITFDSTLESDLKLVPDISRERELTTSTNSRGVMVKSSNGFKRPHPLLMYKKAAHSKGLESSASKFDLNIHEISDIQPYTPIKCDGTYTLCQSELPQGFPLPSTSMYEINVDCSTPVNLARSGKKVSQSFKSPVYPTDEIEAITPSAVNNNVVHSSADIRHQQLKSSIRKPVIKHLPHIARFLDQQHLVNNNSPVSVALNSTAYTASDPEASSYQTTPKIRQYNPDSNINQLKEKLSNRAHNLCSAPNCSNCDLNLSTVTYYDKPDGSSDTNDSTFCVSDDDGLNSSDLGERPPCVGQETGFADSYTDNFVSSMATPKHITVNSDNSSFMRKPICKVPVTAKVKVSKERKRSIIYKMKKFAKQINDNKAGDKKIKTLVVI